MLYITYLYWYFEDEFVQKTVLIYDFFKYYGSQIIPV